MGQSSFTSFQRHLKAQGTRPNTIDRYATSVGRSLREVGVPDEAVPIQPPLWFTKGDTRNC